MKRIVVASFLLSAAGAFAAGDYVGTAPLVVGNVRATVDSGTHLLRVTYDSKPNEVDNQFTVRKSQWRNV